MNRTDLSSPGDADSLLLEGCTLVASLSTERLHGLDLIKEAISLQASPDAKNSAGLRAVDVIARGVDSPDAAVAVEWMAEAGYVEAMLASTNASEMPPMMAACYAGNALVVDKFLELGMPGDVKANAPRHRILGGTPFHATVAGYRESRKDDFAAVLRSLLKYCPHGIDVADRLRQKPIDMATKAAATSGDRTLMTAMMNFGVEVSGRGATGADRIIDAMVKKSGDETLRALMVGSSAMQAIREIEAECVVRQLPRPC